MLIKVTPAQIREAEKSLEVMESMINVMTPGMYDTSVQFLIYYIKWFSCNFYLFIIILWFVYAANASQSHINICILLVVFIHGSLLYIWNH